MQPLLDDLAAIYAEVGIKANKEDGSTVFFMFDTSIEGIEESGFRAARTISAYEFGHGEMITTEAGKVYEVAKRPIPYGSMDEEQIIVLKVV